ncbi:MAG: IS66 family insertion sequence element accessory protein TnpB [Phycisphaerae bacterium]
MNVTPQALGVTPSAATPIYFYTTPTDMRKGFDGLCGLVEQASDLSVTGGGLFVFVNRRRDRMKLLCFDGDGLVLWYKLLQRGTWQVPAGTAGTAGTAQGGRLKVDARQLRLILDGVDLASVKRRKRFVPQ